MNDAYNDALKVRARAIANRQELNQMHQELGQMRALWREHVRDIAMLGLGMVDEGLATMPPEARIAYEADRLAFEALDRYFEEKT